MQKFSTKGIFYIICICNLFRTYWSSMLFNFCTSFQLSNCFLFSSVIYDSFEDTMLILRIKCNPCIYLYILLNWKLKICYNILTDTLTNPLASLSGSEVIRVTPLFPTIPIPFTCHWLGIIKPPWSESWYR